MVLTAIAVASGIVLGLLRGGRVSALLRVPVRWWPVLVAGLALHVAGEHGPGGPRLALLVAGLVLLLVWAGRNLVRVPGAAVVAVGLGANLAVVAANGHVPVRWDALVQVGQFAADQRDQVRRDGLYRVEDDDTRLAFLGDILAVPVVDEVVSFGDLIVLAGVVTVTANVLLARRREGVSPEELFAEQEPPPSRPVVKPSTPVVVDLREPLRDWTERPEPSRAGR